MDCTSAPSCDRLKPFCAVAFHGHDWSQRCCSRAKLDVEVSQIVAHTHLYNSQVSMGEQVASGCAWDMDYCASVFCRNERLGSVAVETWRTRYDNRTLRLSSAGRVVVCLGCPGVDSPLFAAFRPCSRLGKHKVLRQCNGCFEIGASLRDKVMLVGSLVSFERCSVLSLIYNLS